MANNNVEEQLLGLLIQQPVFMFELTELKAEYFSATINSTLFSIIKGITEEGKVADTQLIINHANSLGLIGKIGGSQYIEYLSGVSANSSNALEYQNMLINNWRTRELLQLAATINGGSVNSGEVCEIIRQVTEKLNGLLDTTSGSGSEVLSDLIRPAWDEITRKIASPGSVGTFSGIQDIDDVLGGAMPGDTIIIAGRPSMGKTAMAVNMMLNSAKAGVPQAMFSLEMGKQTLIERMLAIDCGIPLTNIRLGRPTQAQADIMAERIKGLKSLPIYLNCHFTPDVNYILSSVRKLVKNKGVKLVHVDYIQLLTSSEENQTAELGRISRAFKLLDEELGITTYLYSQLNRAVELRDDKRPVLSDLRQSGSLEQDADRVMFLYRDDYYNPDSKYKGIIETLVRKNRNGPIGAIGLKFDAQTNVIRGMDEQTKNKGY